MVQITCEVVEPTVGDDHVVVEEGDPRAGRHAPPDVACRCRSTGDTAHHAQTIVDPTSVVGVEQVRRRG